MMCTQLILVLTFVLSLLNATQSWSQIEDIPISEEVWLDRLYAGLLSETIFETKTLNHSRHLTLQSGARINLTIIPEVWSVRSFGVVRQVGGNNRKHFTNFESILMSGKKVTIHVGVMATPTTELRPNPTTWQSQVETHAERTLPGGKPGVKVNYQLDQMLKMGLGIHQQEGHLAYHFKLEHRKFWLAGFLRDHNVLIAARRTDENTEFVASFTEQTWAFSSIIHVLEFITVYTDLAVDLRSKSRVFSKLGLRRYFEGNHALRGFFSLSYDQTLNQVEGGFFIHL